MANLLVHVEQYEVLGVLPSQLESIRYLSTAMGGGRLAFVDGTIDGVPVQVGWERFATLADFLAAEGTSRLVVLDPAGDDILDAEAGEGDWLLFGPSMGWATDAFDGYATSKVSIPGGVLNARDAIPIAAWEVSAWRAP